MTQIEKLTKIGAFIIPYSLIIHGIITSMILLFIGVSILLSGGVISFYIGDPFLIFFNIPFEYSWLYSFTKVDHNVIYIEILTIFIGISIFLVSFFQLARGIKNQNKIFSEGVYKYVRHPQYLAIGMITLPICLYYAQNQQIYIIYAKIIAGEQIIFLLILFAILEEKKLEKNYPSEFNIYSLSTPFLIPFLRIPRKFKYICSGKIVYLSLFIGYWICYLLIYVVYRILPSSQIGSF